MINFFQLNYLESIIFDLGGVIIDIDYNKPIEEFKKLGVTNFEDFFSQNKQNNLIDKLEKGEINANDFRNEIRKISSKNLKDEEIDNAWNSILIGHRPEAIEYIVKLKKNYKIFLLSNSNEIHYKVYSQELKNKFNFESYDQLFDKAYFSFKIGMRKPDLEIYEKIINTHNLNPSKTLFIDDSPINIDSAKKLGIKTILLPQGQYVENILKNLYD